MVLGIRIWGICRVCRICGICRRVWFGFHRSWGRGTLWIRCLVELVFRSLCM